MMGKRRGLVLARPPEDDAMAVIGYRNDGKDERRLGRRVPGAGLSITWVAPKAAGFSERRAFKGEIDELNCGFG